MLEFEHSFIESTQKSSLRFHQLLLYINGQLNQTNFSSGLTTTYSVGLSTHSPNWIGSPFFHVEISFGSPTERTG